VGRPPKDLHYANGVLRNKLGITDREQLKSTERVLVDARQVEIRRDRSLLPAEFSWDRLKHTHRYLFQDVYGWAGAPRDWDVAKVAPDGVLSHFLDGGLVEVTARKLFDQIAADDYLQGFGDQTPVVLAQIYNQLNVIHPFPDGNGRTGRLFIRDLADSTGHPINFDTMDAGELLTATIRGARGNTDDLQALFTAAAARGAPDREPQNRAQQQAQAAHRTTHPKPTAKQSPTAGQPPQQPPQPPPGYQPPGQQRGSGHHR